MRLSAPDDMCAAAVPLELPLDGGVHEGLMWHGTSSARAVATCGFDPSRGIHW